MPTPAVTPKDMAVQSLGTCRIANPLAAGVDALFIDEDQRVLLDDYVTPATAGTPPAEQVSMERAGPRRKIYFDPTKTRAGIVTCGGLCPGLNDVVRAIVLGLTYLYRVKQVHGFQYGFAGFIPSCGHEVLQLTPDNVDGWQDIGGTKLGSSRGPQNPAEIVDCLERMSINQLFVIGGDGTLRGAMAIVEEIAQRNLKIAVIGVPKTIDNDLMFVDESFGFQTAYGAAAPILQCAHVEAKGAPNGIGLVKLMGRHSGFIACYAALSMSDVNFVLIPEEPLVLEGEHGFLKALKRRLDARHHAVIVVAEGAGQDLLAATGEKDASGNARLQDIGVFLRDRIVEHLKGEKMDFTIKYIDPSYIIRSVPANASDSVYCLQLGHDAVHAAMAGKTAMIVGRWHGLSVHLPMRVVTMARKRVDTSRSLWRSVLQSTGQARWHT